MIFVLSFISITYMDNLTAIAVIFLCLFCIFLYYENKKLNQIIEDLRSRDKDRYEENIRKEDIVAIDDISHVIKDNHETINKNNEEVVSNKSNTVEIKRENREVEKEIVNNNARKISNVDIVDKNNNKREEVASVKVVSDKKNSDDNVSNKFYVEDFIMKDKYVNRKLDSSDMNSEYLQEVSRELESNVVPQTIKLTDYEQEQEDNAIISYKELLDVNNKQEETINDGTVEFIEELKKFRNNLRK